MLRKARVDLSSPLPLSFTLRGEVKAIYTLIAVYRRSLASGDLSLSKRRDRKLLRSLFPFVVVPLQRDLRFQNFYPLILIRSCYV